MGKKYKIVNNELVEANSVLDKDDVYYVYVEEIDEKSLEINNNYIRKFRKTQIKYEQNEAELFCYKGDVTPPAYQRDAELYYYKKCDKYDYLSAVGCGVVGGCIDIFLVGAPGASVLGSWTDAQTNKFVMFFARRNGWKPRPGQENNVKSAIGYLEREYPVNYDQQHNAAAGGAAPGMTTVNHHVKSLSHSPSPIGLFYSILNQFTDTSTFLSNGKIITITTDTFELRGNNFISKLFCGFVNWLGHIISDMAGSSGAVGRGSGVPIPFFELFQLCNFVKFRVGEHLNTLATLATKVFQNGYDLRFGAAAAIPVILSELIVRLIWALKRYFYHKLPIEKCIPKLEHDNLRTMIIISHGTLCLFDATDAAARSGGNALAFALRLNIIAWYRLVSLVLKEVFIRLNIAADEHQYLEAYVIVNGQLREYLAKLERLDIEKFRKEVEGYENMVRALNNARSNAALNAILVEQMKVLGLEAPWDDNFEGWMDAENDPLVVTRRLASKN